MGVCARSYYGLGEDFRITAEEYLHTYHSNYFRDLAQVCASSTNQTKSSTCFMYRRTVRWGWLMN